MLIRRIELNRSLCMKNQRLQISLVFTLFSLFLPPSISAGVKSPSKTKDSSSTSTDLIKQARDKYMAKAISPEEVMIMGVHEQSLRNYLKNKLPDQTSYFLNPKTGILQERFKPTLQEYFSAIPSDLQQKIAIMMRPLSEMKDCLGLKTCSKERYPGEKYSVDIKDGFIDISHSDNPGHLRFVNRLPLAKGTLVTKAAAGKNLCVIFDNENKLSVYQWIDHSWKNTHLQQFKDSIDSLTVSAGGKTIIVHEGTGVVHTYYLKDGTWDTFTQMFNEPISSITISGDGETLALVYNSKLLKVYTKIDNEWNPLWTKHLNGYTKVNNIDEKGRNIYLIVDGEHQKITIGMPDDEVNTLLEPHWENKELLNFLYALSEKIKRLSRHTYIVLDKEQVTLFKKLPRPIREMFKNKVTTEGTAKKIDKKRESIKGRFDAWMERLIQKHFPWED
jgi:hypothetical protein